jgi:Fe2+ transport system protein FeoA
MTEELADGLDETYRRCLGLGLAPGAAAEAAVAEFGDPHLIVAEFARVSLARRAARRLLRTGPVAGGCWAVALITGRAWTWHLPAVVGIAAGLALGTVIVLLAVAARSTRYRPAARAGAAGCTGIALLDTAMITGVLVADPAVTRAVIIAVAVSAGRLAFSARCCALSWSSRLSGG